MKLSWSHKLFLSINKRIGVSPIFDRIAYFCAQWLVWILAGLFALWVLRAGYASGIVTFFLPPLLLSYLLSFGIGYLWRHERPEREFPMIKQLITPLQSWKSFPSDHTIFVTLLFLFATFLLFYFPPFPTWLVWTFGMGGIFVMMGRVYAGVHYPRDILGGIVVAGFSALILFLYWRSLLQSNI